MEKYKKQVIDLVPNNSSTPAALSALNNLFKTWNDVTHKPLMQAQVTYFISS